MKETEQIEFKKSTSELDQALNSISAILNKHQKGEIYFGIKNDGTVHKFTINDSTLRDVSRKIYEFIKPQIFPIVSIEVINEIEIIKVQFEGNDIPYSSKGKYYIRIADEDRELTPSELKKIMIQNEYKENFEDHITSETIDDVDDETFKKFYNSAVSCNRLPNVSFDKYDILYKLDLLKNGFLTNAGKLLFSKNNPIVLKTAIFATDQKTTFLDIQRYEGNIFDLVQKGMKYIVENINWRVEFNQGIQRVEIPEIPVNALREALINSFAHARYDISIQHEIDIFSNRVSITNPGCFANDNTPLDYSEKELRSYLRNEKIAKILFLSNDVETFGHGLKKVYSLCKEQNISINYINHETDFTFEFSRIDRNNMSNGVINGITNGTINDNEKCILNIIIKDPKITIAEMAIQSNKSIRTINRILNSLKEKKLVKRMNSNKDGYWEVLK